jgi:hypothetical protein
MLRGLTGHILPNVIHSRRQAFGACRIGFAAARPVPQDHGLSRPGRPLADAAAILGEMATAVESFLDSVVWPAG